MNFFALFDYDSTQQVFIPRQSMRINVKRTSGDMESDWIITSMSDGLVHAMKINESDNDQMLQKRIALADILDWNTFN